MEIGKKSLKKKKNTSNTKKNTQLLKLSSTTRRNARKKSGQNSRCHNNYYRPLTGNIETSLNKLKSEDYEISVIKRRKPLVPTL
jgi:hypothetical protein